MTSADQELAYTDPLTGLGTQRRFSDRIARLIATREDDPAPFAIFILDLDGFRPINDLYGRQAGDAILAQAATRLRASLEGDATVTRVGPDEFAFLYPMIFSETAATRQARMLIELISAPYNIGDRTARLSATIGGALFQSPDETPARLIQKAESALYQAKKDGRGRIVVYTSQMEEDARRATQIEQALRRAVSNDGVEPWFQPIVDLGTRDIVGFEALARWTDRDLGAVPPSVFIAIAEQRGFIDDLSDLLLRKALSAASAWPENLFLSFNLSPVQLADGSTAGRIQSLIAATGFDAQRLDIEITETALVTDPDCATTIIDKLRRDGIRIALDDFGTGQSSLGRLRDFRFDKIKIDRAFVSASDNDTASRHILRAILAMCRDLGIDAIAEGIETEEQAELLIEFGCGGGQGWLFGKPMPEERTTNALRLSGEAQG